MTTVWSDSTALLPAGLLTIDQRYVIGLRSGSEEPLPSRFTKLPRGTVCGGPALATGGEFSVEMVTVTAGLSTVPSLTINWMT